METVAVPGRWKRNRIIATVVLLTVSVLAVSALFVTKLGDQSGGTPQAQSTELPAPAMEYANADWLDDWLVVDAWVKVPGPPDHPEYPLIDASRLRELRPDGTGIQPLHVPDRTGCYQTNFGAPKLLPDGRLGYIQMCAPTANSGTSELYMMALDMTTQQTTQLLKYPLPQVRTNSNAYTWNPQMTKGIASNVDGLAEKLYWFTPDKWEYVPLNFSRTVAPAWSPDGNSIAFFGAPDEGLYGISQVDANFNLYVMSPDLRTLSILTEGYKYPSSTAWSPDGRQVAFNGKHGDKQGIWLFDMNEGKVRLLAEGEFLQAEWSPDGRQLLAINVPEPLSPNRTLVIVTPNK